MAKRSSKRWTVMPNLLFGLTGFNNLSAKIYTKKTIFKIILMKKVLFPLFSVSVIALFIAVSPMSSCTKDVEKIVTDTVFKCNTGPLGLWEGDFLTSQVSHPPGYVAFVLYSDSTISRRTKNPTADIYHRGRWKMTGNKITFTDTTLNFTSVVIQNGSFDYNASTNTLMNGTWQQTGANLSGTFSTMQKIK